MIAIWTEARPNFVKAVQKYDKIRTGWVTRKMADRMDNCDKMCKRLEEVKAEVHVNGRGYQSKAVLEERWVMCRQVSSLINVADYVLGRLEAKRL